MGQLKLVIQTPEPVRLCEYLRRRIGVSARLLARLKRTPAGILCNGVPVRAVDSVCAGDVVVLTMPEQEGLEPNPALYVPSVLETAHYIVYDKPTGMPVHPSARHRRDTLGNYFAASMPGHTFRAVNRLDRDTSGLCMIAKDAYTASALQGKLEKRYYAVLCGHLTGDGTISAPIARTEASIITRCVRQDGKPAVTHYRVLGHSADYTAVEIRLETGRTHQIRVHFAHLGYPLGVGICSSWCWRYNWIGGIEMKKIASFEVDHRKIDVGMYISRVDGDIVTYDIRMCKPNGGVYLPTPAMHTIEHLFATYARNSEYGQGVVYVGPMGCRTGFYLLTRGLSHQDAIRLMQETYQFIADYDGEIPGCSEIECGNYLEHDLAGAKRAVLPFLSAIQGYTPEMLDYTWHYNQK